MRKTFIKFGMIVIIALLIASCERNRHAEREKMIAALSVPHAPISTEDIISAENIKVGTTVNRMLEAGDEHWFSIKTETGDILVIETTGSTDTYMELYDGEITYLLAKDDDSGDGFNARIALVTESGKVYTVKIKGAGRMVDGNYNLHVNYSDVEIETLKVGMNENENIEEDNWIAGLFEGLFSYIYHIYYLEEATENDVTDFKSDEHCFSFTVNEKGRYKIETFTWEEELDIDVTLFDKNFKLLDTVHNYVFDSAYSRDIVAELESGTYYVVVRLLGYDTELLEFSDDQPSGDEIWHKIVYFIQTSKINSQ